MSAQTRPEDVRAATRVLVSIAVIALVAVGATVAVRAAYGAFADEFTVETRFARAGQGLRAGTDVKYRGVNVGKVGSVELRDRGIDVSLKMRDGVEVPKATKASVRPKTVFGEKYVELSAVPGDPPPYLEDGDRVESAGTGLEVEQLLDTSDDLLREVDADELAILMDELVQAYQGEGDRVAELIDGSVASTDVLVSTLDAQLTAIDSFGRFAKEYEDIGPAINAINANLNDLLPTFNAAREDYERLLTTLRPFADHLSELIEVTEADLGQLLADGDNIVRVLTARKANISETVRGLDIYTGTLADAIAPGALPDGSRYGHMKIFIDFSQLRDLLCAVLGPDTEPVDLSAVRAELARRVPELACPGDGGSGGSGGGDGGGGGVPAPPTLPGTPAPDPITDLVSDLASPDLSMSNGTVGDLLVPLLGAEG